MPFSLQHLRLFFSSSPSLLIDPNAFSQHIRAPMNYWDGSTIYCLFPHHTLKVTPPEHGNRRPSNLPPLLPGHGTFLRNGFVDVEDVQRGFDKSSRAVF